MAPSARTTDNASKAPRPTTVSTPLMLPLPLIAEVDAALSTWTAVGGGGGVITVAGSMSPSSRLKTLLVAVVSLVNHRPCPHVPPFEAFEVMYRPKEKNHPAVMQQRLLEATQTLKLRVVKKKKSSSFDKFATIIFPASPSFGGLVDTAHPMTMKQRSWSPMKDAWHFGQ